MRRSRTRAAVTYGPEGLLALYKSKHPEYDFKGPYGDKPLKRREYLKTFHGSGYTNAALEGMGYTNAALEGMGYTNAALEGMGYGEEAGAIISALASQIGGQGVDALAAICEQIGMSVTELLTDPKLATKVVGQFFPSLGNKLKNFFTSWWKKKGEEKKADKEIEEKRQYLAYLKKYFPQEYAKIYKQLHEQAWAEFERQNRAKFFGENGLTDVGASRNSK